jgi:Tol biopolymer transport system component
VTDDDSGDIGIDHLFPIHHDAPAWSVRNEIAFRDNGIACVNPGNGRAQIDPARRGIWVLDMHTRQLDLLVPDGDRPAWSPTGDTLAFVAGGQINKTPRTGATITTLTSRGANANPAWSPDGLLIAYESTSGNSRGVYEIWMMRSDGSKQTNITANAIQWGEPQWNPNGERIVHERRLATVGNEIFSMDRTGSNELRLTDNSFEDTQPRYSPDGQLVVFVAQGLAGSGIPRLVLANADGTGARVLSDSPAGRPAWSPDGSTIVFVRRARHDNDPANGVLWLLDVATGAETQLTWGERGPCP